MSWNEPLSTGPESHLMSKFVFVLAITVFQWLSSANAEDVWRADIDAALETAKADGKDLILFYTGSDWSEPCQKMVAEILGKQEFLDASTKDFVLVEFDFPHDHQLSPQTVRQNQNWADKFGIQDFPTIILIDQKQRPFGITGYREGGVEAYLGTLADFRQKRLRRDEALAKAELLQGPERAKMLDLALSELDPSLAQLYYEGIVAEIVDLDREDELGLRTKWNASRDSEMRQIIMTDIVMVSRLEKPEVAIKFIDDVLKEFKFPAQQRLQILQMKLNLLRKSEQIAGLDQVLDDMIAIEELTDESRQRLVVKKIFFMIGTDRREQGLKLLDDSIAKSGSFAHYLWLAKGQLLDADGRHDEAIACFDAGINNGDPTPDVLIELYGAKADAYMALKNELRAMQSLDRFSENKEMPADLRAEAMLQKAMIMRASGRDRQATLVENRAIEISGSPDEQSELRKLVAQLRKKQGG